MRTSIPVATETALLLLSRRRCCLCFGLHQSTSLKKGQIAHLDHRPSNNALDNLAWLCFDHHDAFDSRSSQSKNYTIAEVKAYRQELYTHLEYLIQEALDETDPEYETEDEGLMYEGRTGRTLIAASGEPIKIALLNHSHDMAEAYTRLLNDRFPNVRIITYRRAFSNMLADIVESHGVSLLLLADDPRQSEERSAARLIQYLYPQYAGIITVVCSCHNDREYLLYLRQLGADEILIMPFPIAHFMSAFCAALGEPENS